MGYDNYFLPYPDVEPGVKDERALLVKKAFKAIVEKRDDGRFCMFDPTTGVMVLDKRVGYLKRIRTRLEMPEDTELISYPLYEKVRAAYAEGDL